jgi:hypothetical protein
MLHTLHSSLQNVVYFIMLPILVLVLFTFYIQDVLKFKCKTPVNLHCVRMNKLDLFKSNHNGMSSIKLQDATCYKSVQINSEQAPKAAQPTTSHTAEPSGRTVYEFQSCDAHIVNSNPTGSQEISLRYFLVLWRCLSLAKGLPSVQGVIPDVCK